MSPPHNRCFYFNGLMPLHYKIQYNGVELLHTKAKAPLELLISIASFTFIVLAARQIGDWFSNLNLPLISGYLLAGIIAGPFVLKFITPNIIEDLRFLDEVSLAFIAFAAGSELNPAEIRTRLKSIAWHSIGQIIAIFVLGMLAILLLAPQIPFMADMEPSGHLAVAIIGGVILIARSPSSAIAIITELRARGPFTRTVLGVTILMDVVVVVLFAISTSIADILLTVGEFNLSFIILLVLELAGSVLLGYLTGYLMGWMLRFRINRLIKILLILLIGFAIFDLTLLLRDYSHEHLPVVILLEPLLICLIASFVVTNTSPHRQEYLGMIDDASPLVFIVFFTLVGDALQLDILAQTLVITLVIFGVRLLGLFIGSYVGGSIADDPPNHSRWAWMAYITQAGIGLGLAKEAADEFPQLGDEFATMIISVIVISQLIGPPFLNNVIRRVKEAHIRSKHTDDESRDALIFGIDRLSITLAKQLYAANWQVMFIDNKRGPEVADIPEHFDRLIVDDFDISTLKVLVRETTDAVITMMDDDALNCRICEEVRDHFSVPRVIVRLSNPDPYRQRLQAAAVSLVDADTATVNLLEQYTRAPITTALLLKDDPDYKMVHVTIANPDVDGLRIRDLRLPEDVLVYGILREGHAIVPHGHTVIRKHDELTLVGQRKSIETVAVHLGY